MLYDLKELMNLCTDFAISGVNENIGGPFGAAVVEKVDDKYKIISLARNTVVSTNDPTNHAEMNAIREACKVLNTFDLSDYELITSGQSCPMCLSAIIWANIKTVYYGTDYIDAENIGFRDKHIYEHLNGKILAVKEVQVYRDIAIKCHNVWEIKVDKVDY